MSVLEGTSRDSVERNPEYEIDKNECTYNVHYTNKYDMMDDLYNRARCE